jgi:hypothetical protein
MQTHNLKNPNALRSGLDVKDGDLIRVLDKAIMKISDEGEQKSAIVVGIVRGGEIIAQKNFGLDKTNYEAMAAVHGYDWLNEEMRINIVKKRVSSGQLVDTIALSLPIIELPANPNRQKR